MEEKRNYVNGVRLTAPQGKWWETLKGWIAYCRFIREKEDKE